MSKSSHISHRLWAALLLTLVTLTVSPGCTRNNGDIGDWFGTWRLETITVDGKPDPGYTDYMIWKFQSDLLMLMIPDDATHSHTDAIGRWSQQGDRLMLDFEYYLGNMGPLNTVLHLPQTAALDILRLSGSRIELRYTAPDGTQYYYSLKKWG